VEIVGDLPGVVGIEVGRLVQEGSGRLDLMLRPSTRRSRGQISVLVELS
jgi:hypothetical protein